MALLARAALALGGRRAVAPAWRAAAPACCLLARHASSADAPPAAAAAAAAAEPAYTITDAPGAPGGAAGKPKWGKYVLKNVRGHTKKLNPIARQVRRPPPPGVGRPAAVPCRARPHLPPARPPRRRASCRSSA